MVRSLETSDSDVRRWILEGGFRKFVLSNSKPWTASCTGFNYLSYVAMW